MKWLIDIEKNIGHSLPSYFTVQSIICQFNFSSSEKPEYTIPIQTMNREIMVPLITKKGI